MGASVVPAVRHWPRVVYLIYYAAKRDDLLYLGIDAAGQIYHRSSSSRWPIVLAFSSIVVCLACLGLALILGLFDVAQTAIEGSDFLSTPALTAFATSAPAPTNAPPRTAAPPPTTFPTEAPGPDLEIQGVSRYVDSIGALHLVGEVLSLSS